jgi:hypothetical protein
VGEYCLLNPNQRRLANVGGHVAVLSVTGTTDVLGSLIDVVDFPLAIVAATAVDNGDDTWSVTAETSEDNVSALESMGCTVQVVISDADQIQQWDELASQINDELPSS